MKVLINWEASIQQTVCASINELVEAVSLTVAFSVGEKPAQEQQARGNQLYNMKYFVAALVVCAIIGMVTARPAEGKNIQDHFNVIHDTDAVANCYLNCFYGCYESVGDAQGCNIDCRHSCP